MQLLLQIYALLGVKFLLLKLRLCKKMTTMRYGYSQPFSEDSHLRALHLLRGLVPFMIIIKIQFFYVVNCTDGQS